MRGIVVPRTFCYYAHRARVVLQRFLRVSAEIATFSPVIKSVISASNTEIYNEGKR